MSNLLLTFFFTILAFEKINQSYFGIQTKIYNAISFIDHTQWHEYKARFIFAKDYSRNNSNELIVDPFSAKDLRSLINKYTEDQGVIKKFTNFVAGGSSNVDDIVQKVKHQAQKIKDNEFVQKIPIDAVNNSEYVIQQFLKCYQDWKKSKFPKIISSIIQKYEEEIDRKSDQDFKTKRELIFKKHFQSICGQIESNCLTKNLLIVLKLEFSGMRICYYFILIIYNVPNYLQKVYIVYRWKR